MPPISYRPIQDADITALPGLIRTAFAEYHGRLDPPSSAERKTEAVVRAELQDGDGWVAVAGDQLVGCVFGRQQDGAYYLDRLSVLPSWRGQGIARMLLQQVEAQARQLRAPALALSVRIALEQQQDLYRSLGFVFHAWGTHAGYAEPTYLQLRKPLI